MHLDIGELYRVALGAVKILFSYRVFSKEPTLEHLQELRGKIDNMIAELKADLAS